MPTSFLSKLNLSIVSGFERAVLSGQQNSVNLFLGQGKSLSRNSVLPCSTAVLPDSSHCSLTHSVKSSPMAASNSAAAIGDVFVDDLHTSCGNALELAKPNGVFFNDKSRTSCQRATLSLRRKELSNHTLISCGHLDSPFGPRWRSLHSSSRARCSSGAAHNSPSEQNLSSATLSDQVTLLGDRTMKLVSGVCYLPHPEKEATGGEDAHFICTDEQAIGVADGVGGWADVGVNAGLFSRQLMSNAVAAIREEPKGSIDPLRVLDKAHKGTNAKGSSTACIVVLTEKGLHAINLGDSGFIVVRDGSTIFQSPVQQHGFNFTYQLESGSRADLPSAGQVFTIPVVPGDIVVAGTDGLFDNVYNNEITAVVLHAVGAGMESQEMAQKIAALARMRAMDRTRQSPFASAAQQAGFRYYGGKLDDITVVVSYVTNLVDA